MVFSSYDALEPQDLTFLRQVLNEACAERGLAIDHPDAQAIARELVNWYLFGVKDGGELKAMLVPIPPEQER